MAPQIWQSMLIQIKWLKRLSIWLIHEEQHSDHRNGDITTVWANTKFLATNKIQLCGGKFTDGFTIQLDETTDKSQWQLAASILNKKWTRMVFLIIIDSK